MCAEDIVDIFESSGLESHELISPQTLHNLGIIIFFLSDSPSHALEPMSKAMEWDVQVLHYQQSLAMVSRALGKYDNVIALHNRIGLEDFKEDDLIECLIQGYLNSHRNTEAGDVQRYLECRTSKGHPYRRFGNVTARRLNVGSRILARCVGLFMSASASRVTTPELGELARARFSPASV